MSEKFGFSEFEKKPEQPKQIEIKADPIFKVEEPAKDKRKIPFQDFPKDTSKILENKAISDTVNKYIKEEPIPIPSESAQQTSYLSLILSPNFREIELMIRGLEYVKRFNPVTQKDEVILRKIENHPLNEYGINKIMEFLRIYSMSELKLGRKKERDYYNSVHQVGYDIVRLIYKNLKNFGMDTQVKQRNAKTFCLAIIEVADATFSRSIEGKENDISRATSFEVTGSVDMLDDPASKIWKGKKKEELKN